MEDMTMQTETTQATCVNCGHTGDHDDNDGFCKVCGEFAAGRKSIKADNGRTYEIIKRQTADDMEAAGLDNVARTMRENYIVADLHVRNARSGREHLVYERLVKTLHVNGPATRELVFQYVVAL
jgi:hypothetical protein